MEKPKKKIVWIVTVIVIVVVIIIAVIVYKKSEQKKAIENALKSDEPATTGPAFKPEPGKNRAVRNNNPFNLRLTSLAWTGKVPKAQNTDGQFEQFYEKKFGVRAGIKNIITQVVRKQKDTIDSLIKVYAPPVENDTTRYIQLVSEWTGIAPDVKFEPSKDNILKISGAIARKEGATLTDAELNEAYALI